MWNAADQTLYFTNAYGNEICIYDEKTNTVSVRSLPLNVAAMAFDEKNRLVVSHKDGVHVLNGDDSLSPIYDHATYEIKHANDMKVGPDGAIYVGTQSGKRLRVSAEIDGKLYRISPTGAVTVLLDGLILSNGMEWSLDETKFYHTDSPTKTIKEYHFNKETGQISPTGRAVEIKGVDGFAIGLDGRLYVGCWGQGHVAIVDTDTLTVSGYIDTPTKIPTSCGFCGEGLDVLAITTASLSAKLDEDPSAGFTILQKVGTRGRKPYLFGTVKGK